MSIDEDQTLFRVLELYCGIGGCAAAIGQHAEVVEAVDINRTALEVYRLNFSHPATTATIESLTTPVLKRLRADLWWLSPPCQPFTRRGRRRDVRDPRTHSLLLMLDRIEEVRPTYLAMENVPGFEGSIAHSILLETLSKHGYSVQEQRVCPTQLGIPNRRKRYYLVAGRGRLQKLPPASVDEQPLRWYLDRRPPRGLSVDKELARRYRHALDIVDPLDPMAVSACFTSAYGHSPIRSGSYLRTPSGLRRFSPSEILRLLGFPKGFRLPESLSIESAWRLVGNSLSIPAVRYVLSAVPQLSALAPRGRRATTA